MLETRGIFGLGAGRVLSLALVAALSACGGGSKGSGPDQPPGPPPPLKVSVQVLGTERASATSTAQSVEVALPGPTGIELVSTRAVAWTPDTGAGPVTVTPADGSTPTDWVAVLGLPAGQSGTVTLTGVAQDGSGQQVVVNVSLTDGRGAGAYDTDRYPDLFVDLLGKTEDEVQAKIDAAFAQLFSTTAPTDPTDAQLYFEDGADMAYIQNVYSSGGADVSDVRSEGMSYGMMIAVQLDKQDMFNRLWKWSKTYMQHSSGALQGYFSWEMNPNGTAIDGNPAPDGEEWYATALFLAANRWGDGTGIYDYTAEAQAILDTTLHKEEQAGHGTITDMFGATNHQVVFQPLGDGATFTDPSYHLPGFYELWARWADKDQAAWCAVAAASRAFLPTAADATRGLSPDYAAFGGTPFNPSWSSTDHTAFRADAQRVAANIGVDQLWFRRGGADTGIVDHLLAFLRSDGLSSAGVASYCNSYKLDGTCLSARTDPTTFRSAPGFVAMNAAAVHAAATPSSDADFVQSLWDVPVTTGKYQYYGKMLYMLGLLEASGHFRVYHPATGPVVGCP